MSSNSHEGAVSLKTLHPFCPWVFSHADESARTKQKYTESRVPLIFFNHLNF